MERYNSYSPLPILLIIKEVQREFNGRYRYLKIEFTISDISAVFPQDDQQFKASLVARQLLWNEFGTSDEMKVSELEILLKDKFGTSAQVFRQSVNLWLETSMTRHWSLREQNDHGRDLEERFGI
jgi:hypothetical protein